ncbi:MAG: hypothetical protein HO274_07205 [Ferrovum myxofaciens]|uniref:hypothetical protein n=1 Tax=Ferrovum myxofaciens TaxID=416213 RepID=UPI00235214EE|nr:hypothetical protein [Ferrovum myxofaciens]QKE41119.1 MAG: hypothetical protein HO274_07205 [Ferrovum myxofaciens]
MGPIVPSAKRRINQQFDEFAVGIKPMGDKNARFAVGSKKAGKIKNQIFSTDCDVLHRL